MTTREKMIKWREANGITLRKLSDQSGISETLLSMVEAGNVTHPKLVKIIKRLYKLTNDEAEELLPKNYRRSNPEYDPNKFVQPVPKLTDGAKPIKKELVQIYVEEHQDRMARQHQRRGNY